MPGRLSIRTSTAPRLSRKSSIPSLDARASTAPPNTVVPEEGPPTALRTRICDIFADAQKTTAGHRKLVINLRKIHEACCYEPSKIGKKTLDDFDENDFNSEFARCVTRVMVVKKSEEIGDRLVRFLGLFLRHASDKGGYNYASFFFGSYEVLSYSRCSPCIGRSYRRYTIIP